MRYRDLLIEELTYRTETRGYSHGQTDLRLLAYDDDEYVGHIDYSIYDDEPAVQMISVPEKRRRGYATAMVRHLQSEFPDTEINMGGLTDDGSKLLASIPQQVIQNPEYQEKMDRLKRVKSELAQYTAMTDAFDANPTEQARQAILAFKDRWNELYDEEWQLEQELRDMRPAKRLYA